MRNLIKNIVRNILLEQQQKTIGLFGGGFKPPTKGHFEVILKGLHENPELDKLIVLVGSKPRDGITQQQSLDVWEEYKKILPSYVDIVPSPKPPIGAIYSYAKNHPGEKIVWIIGAREGNEDDIKDIISRSSSIEKHPNLTLSPTSTPGGVSGTLAREDLLNGEKESFFTYLPDGIDKEKIWTILTQR
jgi:hypothetical protein